MMNTPRTIEIFISSAPDDKEALTVIEMQLRPAMRNGQIHLWGRGDVIPGRNVEQEVTTHLENAHVILLLVSPSYMASDDLYQEMVRAIHYRETKQTQVIPILLRSVQWEDTLFGNLKPLPANRQPINRWRDKSEAFYEVAQGVKRVVAELQGRTLEAPLFQEAKKQQEAVPPGKASAMSPSPSASIVSPAPLLAESSAPSYDVFLSHSHRDAAWVENIARTLEDEQNFRVWLDKWILIPGQSFQQAMASGLDQAKCCVVCISDHTPEGWCQQEVERALNRQARDSSFRVIPILLPNAQTVNVDNFLELRTWVDFRGSDSAYALHLLTSGIKGVSPGRWPPRKA